MLHVLVPLTPEAKREGLLPYTLPPENWGMFFLNTSIIHTMGMKFPIDVVLLDTNFNILDIKTVPPGIKSFGSPATSHILELAPNTAHMRGLHLCTKIYPFF